MADEFLRAGAEAARLAALIQEQSRAEAERLLEESRARTAQIAAAAEEEAARVTGQARAEGEARGRRRAARTIAVAESAAHRRWLGAREALIDAVLERVRGHLLRPEGETERAELLAALVREALAHLPEEPLRVCVGGGREICEPALRAALGDLAARVAEIVSAPHADWVSVETADGRLRFVNTLEARLSRQADELRRLAAQTLFGEPGPTARQGTA